MQVQAKEEEVTGKQIVRISLWAAYVLLVVPTLFTAPLTCTLLAAGGQLLFSGGVLLGAYCMRRDLP